MPAQNDALRKQLSKRSEITITVTGRRSKRKIALPVWFVWDDGTLYLLPVKGSDTQWYKNVLQQPSIGIKVRSAKTEVKVTPVTDAERVKSVIERFRAKYGAGDVKKYYSKFDVAVIAQTR